MLQRRVSLLIERRCKGSLPLQFLEWTRGIPCVRIWSVLLLLWLFCDVAHLGLGSLCSESQVTHAGFKNNICKAQFVKVFNNAQRWESCFDIYIFSQEILRYVKSCFGLWTHQNETWSQIKKSFETRSDWCLYLAAQKLWVRRDLRYFPDQPTYCGFI